MDYASVMVYVEDVDSANARIELACDIADLFEAGLIGISASVPDMPMIDPYTGGAMLGQVWRRSKRSPPTKLSERKGAFAALQGPAARRWLGAAR